MQNEQKPETAADGPVVDEAGLMSPNHAIVLKKDDVLTNQLNKEVEAVESAQKTLEVLKEDAAGEQEDEKVADDLLQKPSDSQR